MDDGTRHGIAFGGMGTALGVMAQLSPLDAWYRPYLWYAAFALLSLSIVVWVWPYIRWVIDRPRRKREIEEARERLTKQRPINASDFTILYPPRYPDFPFLDGKNVFALREAAALWLNQAPEMPLRKEALEKYHYLHDEIYAGRLKAKLNLDEILSLASTQVGDYPQDGEDPITVETLIGREELRRFALTTSERPMFLFKDQRAGKKPI